MALPEHIFARDTTTPKFMGVSLPWQQINDVVIKAYGSAADLRYKNFYQELLQGDNTSPKPSTGFYSKLACESNTEEFNKFAKLAGQTAEIQVHSLVFNDDVIALSVSNCDASLSGQDGMAMFVPIGCRTGLQDMDTKARAMIKEFTSGSYGSTSTVLPLNDKPVVKGTYQCFD